MHIAAVSQMGRGSDVQNLTGPYVGYRKNTRPAVAYVVDEIHQYADLLNTLAVLGRAAVNVVVVPVVVVDVRTILGLSSSHHDSAHISVDQFGRNSSSHDRAEKLHCPLWLPSANLLLMPWILDD